MTSRWRHWSKGTEEKGQSFSNMFSEGLAADQARKDGLQSAGYGWWRDSTGQIVAKTVNDQLQYLASPGAEAQGTAATLDTGNPTSAASGLTPADQARAMGLTSNGSGGYVDQEGNVVARTVNNELMFYDNGPGGGAISSGGGGAQLTQSSPSWVDPVTGIITVPPAQPESPEERAAVPDPVPAQMPFSFDAFMIQKKKEAYAAQEQRREEEAAIEPDPLAPNQVVGMPEGVTFESFISEAPKDPENPGAPPRGYKAGHPQFRDYDNKLALFKAFKEKQDIANAKRSLQGMTDRALERTGESPQEAEAVTDPVEPRQLSRPDPEDDGTGGKLDRLLADVRARLADVADTASADAANEDDLADELRSAAADGNIQGVVSALQSIKDRNEEGAVSDDADPNSVYEVVSPGGLGSDRGNYVEQGLTDHVFPKIFEGEGMEFFNDGGSRVKTDVRSQRDGEDVDRYTVKTTVGNDGLEANNAGFRRFFDMWNLDPTSGPGQMFSHLMGIPLDWAQEQGFGDDLGLWDDKRDGLHRDGQQASRQMPLQLMYPGINFSTEELNANSFSPARFRQMFPQIEKEGMEWLMDNRGELMRRIMSQRDNDFGPDGAPDPNAKPNVDFDPSPTNRAAWYHLDKSSKGSPFLKGKLDIHDISEEAVKPILEKANWELGDGISSGLRLNADGGGRRPVSLLNLSRKANKAGGGRYGNGFHSPRFGYNHNAFDLYPHVSSTPVEMTMGARRMVPEMNAKGQAKVDRQGQPKMKSERGLILPESVKIGETKWGKGYGPNQG